MDYQQSFDGAIVKDQQRVNCARRSLELWQQGNLPLWTTRHDAAETNAVAARINKEPSRNSGRDSFVTCILEDYLDEPVDHSAKPLELLKRYAHRANRLAAGAFGWLDHDPTDRIWARISNQDELQEILNYLDGKNWLEPEPFKPPAGIRKKRLTVSGWAAIREAMEAESTNEVFIASAFKWPGEDDADRIQAWEAIRNACKNVGYEANVVGQNHTGSITDEIIAAIRRSRFVIAELTYNNRGVYYEAGFARALGKPVFHVLREEHAAGDDREGRRIHFDIRQIQFRTWKTPDDLEKTLTDWIGAAVGHYSRPK